MHVEFCVRLITMHFVSTIGFVILLSIENDKAEFSYSLSSFSLSLSRSRARAVCRRLLLPFHEPYFEFIDILIYTIR